MSKAAAEEILDGGDVLPGFQVHMCDRIDLPQSAGRIRTTVDTQFS